MAGVGRLFHHATGKYGTGHTISLGSPKGLTVCLHYRGVTIPWGSWLWLEPADAGKEGLPFAKLTQLAATAIHNAALPASMPVRVLFDCYYLCPVVVDACRCRRWHSVGVGKAHRNFTVVGGKRKLDAYGGNVARRSDRWMRVRGLRSSRQYRLAERVGLMKSLGTVKVVSSRRRGERKVVALVTDADGGRGRAAASAATAAVGGTSLWS